MQNESHDSSRLTQQELLKINEVCNQFESQWQDWQAAETLTKPQPTVEETLSGLPDHLKAAAVRELVPIEVEYRTSLGQTILTKEYTDRFPEIDTGWLLELLQESISSSGGFVNAPQTDDQETVALSSNTDEEGQSFTLRDQFEDSSGTVIPKQIGQYEIIRALGSGGMGTVYQAVHREMQREVALKMVRADLSCQESVRKRFQREVIAAARLSHPNIVTAYDAGEHHGQPFLVSELINGVDLRKLVKDDGPLSIAVAVKYVKDAATGLQYAHENDIVHRDIKPANLLRDNEDIVKILDLGLARLEVDADSDGESSDLTSELTHSGAVMGTASYMAPEQARSTKRADARSDIYSLGCVLYFLLTGKPPFRGESVVDTLLAHATEPIPEVISDSRQQAIPNRLKTLIHEMMAKSPKDRPQSMAAVIQRLAEFDSDAPLPSIKPQPKAKSQTMATYQNSNSIVKIAIVVCILSITGFACWMYSGRNQSHSNQLPTEELNSGAGPLVHEMNRALQFDGYSSYVEIPSVNRGPGDEVTIEIIARVDDVSVSNSVSWLGGNWMALFHSNHWGIGRLQDGVSLFSVSNRYSDDQLETWRHIAGTWDGQRLRLFLDGHYVRQGPMEYELGETEPGLFVGGVNPIRLPDGQNQRFFHGAIDAVRIVDRVVYKGEETFTPPSHLDRIPDTYVLLQFNARNMAELKDTSGNNHRILARNAVSVVAE